MHVASSCGLKEIYVSEFTAIYGFFTFKYVWDCTCLFSSTIETGTVSFDIMLNAVGCMVKQIPGSELLNFFDHQCQTLLISYHNKGTAFL